jgi:ribonuclease-3 family protein
MTQGDIAMVSELGLAYVGDAVFELMARARLCADGKTSARVMHAETVRRVSARAQAESARGILAELTDAELAAFKRGRNARVRAYPRGVTAGEYHTATGLEALFGFLYLRGETERLGELFEMIWDGDGHGD